MRTPLFFILSCTLLLVTGCASYPANPPLEQVKPTAGYRLQNHIKRPGTDDSVFVILAFSGGGTRAAAFSYGVLKQLSKVTLPGKGTKHQLADEVDVITAVSGGSFTAAYFGLFGNRIFEDFEQRFLRRDIQSELTTAVLFNPINWFRMASPYFGRSDLATELYNETIFDQHTFADLAAADGPFVVINATEMSLGTRFQFDQNYFDTICGDLSRLPIARAVTASSAVPLLFSPVTLSNRAGNCGWREPSWMLDALAAKERTSRLYNLSSNLLALENRSERPYLHLLDGGLADNLGLRAMLDGVLRFEGITNALAALDITTTKRIIVILVNAETALDVETSQHLYAPTLAAVLNAATSVPLQRYSFETVALLKQRLRQWEKDSHASACGSVRSHNPANGECRGVTMNFIEINFSEHPNPNERDYLKRLPTSFRLSDKAVDRLIAAGGLILIKSAAFQQLLRERR